MIPGFLISLITFPGVIIHEWAHKKFCNWLKVPVYKVVYFRFGNPAGFVEHENPTTYKQTFWISVGPLVVNSLTTVLLSIIASQIILNSWLYFLVIWAAFLVGMHSFPSDHDMQHVSHASKQALKHGGSFLHYLSFPFVALVWISNKLRFFWFDAIYAFILIMIGGGL